MMSLPEKRLHAFLLHLAASAIFFLLFVCVLYFYWYPGVFIYFGGIQGIKIVGGVDLVLGPVLTLIVYNKYKKTIKMDLAIIFTFQCACLAVGIWLIYQQRPILQVMKVDSIHLITYAEAKEYKMDFNEIKQLPGSHPKFTWLDLPSSREAINSIALMHDMAGERLEAKMDLYTDFFNMSDDKKIWLQAELQKKQYIANIESLHGSGKGVIDINLGLIKLGAVKQ